MKDASLPKDITRPVVGFTLMVVVATLMPTPVRAKSPGLPKRAQTLVAVRAVSDQAYTLGAGDRLRVDVFNVPEYSGEYQVLVDGTINLPIVGGISVQGMTLTRASQVLSSRYARYLRRPIVTVSLLAPRPLRIAVSGEVNRAGSYTIAPVAGSQFPTVTQAIQLAGGTTQAANARSVQLLRREGKRGIITLNLLEILQRGNLAQDITLRDGDTVFIPTATNVNPEQSRILAAGNFGTQATGAKVVVVGEVPRPGNYTVRGENTGPNGSSKPPTLTQAIQLAGGLITSANIRQIQVRRPTSNGSPQVIAVNLLALLQAGDLNQDILLQDGDTVFIPTGTDVNPADSNIIARSTLAPQSTGPIKIAVVGQVFRPGSQTVTADSTVASGGGATGSKPPTLTRAIQVAGGIKPTADIRKIQVRRFDRNGSEQTIDVNLWQLLQAGDLSQDIPLQEGDKISVPTATKIDPTEADLLASGTIAPPQILVNVVGEVNRPGPVQVPPNTPLNQALLTAGGFNNTRARQSVIDLIRLNPDGTVTKRAVRLDFSQGINEKSNPILRNNDVIVVSRSTLTSVTDTLGTVLSPLGSAFSFLNIFRSLR